MPSKIRDNSGSNITVFQTDCAKLNIISQNRKNIQKGLDKFSRV